MLVMHCRTALSLAQPHAYQQFRILHLTMIAHRQALILQGMPKYLCIARPPSYRNQVTWQNLNEGRVKVRWHVTSLAPYLQRTVL